MPGRFFLFYYGIELCSDNFLFIYPVPFRRPAAPVRARPSGKPLKQRKPYVSAYIKKYTYIEMN